LSRIDVFVSARTDTNEITVKIAANNIVAANCRVDIALVDVITFVDAVAFETRIANALCIEHLSKRISSHVAFCKIVAVAR